MDRVRYTLLHLVNDKLQHKQTITQINQSEKQRLDKETQIVFFLGHYPMFIIRRSRWSVQLTGITTHTLSTLSSVSSQTNQRSKCHGVGYADKDRVRDRDRDSAEKGFPVRSAPTDLFRETLWILSSQILKTSSCSRNLCLH